MVITKKILVFSFLLFIRSSGFGLKTLPLIYRLSDNDNIFPPVNFSENFQSIDVYRMEILVNCNSVEEPKQIGGRTNLYFKIFDKIKISSEKVI